MATIISRHNAKLLRSNKNDRAKECNCTKGNKCPLEGKCQTRNIVYQATIKEAVSQKTETYIGLTSTKFKERLGNHNASFKHKEKAKGCKLAQHAWKLKEKNIQFSISWKILANASAYSSVTNTCNLCVTEKYMILYFPHLGTLNKRSELTSSCRHRNKLLLDKG